ncbi:MAG: prolyl oligopeptidase family serine peptidase, partial [Phycisphaerales bacterium]|nr:prolyl oligopeptidase family serine peptidase [Phycisphaerales bacterium]
ALQLAAIDDRVDCIVTVATFTSLSEIVPEYLNRYWIGRLMLARSVDKAIAESGRIADFDPGDADSLRAIAATDAAVLLIHGKNDANIPFQFSERLCEAGNGQCKLMLLDDEDHVSIYLDRKGIIIRETLAWFAAHLN